MIFFFHQEQNWAKIHNSQILFSRNIYTKFWRVDASIT